MSFIRLKKFPFVPSFLFVWVYLSSKEFESSPWLISRFRIQSCHSCGSGYSCGLGSFLSPGTSACCRGGQKKGRGECVDIVKCFVCCYWAIHVIFDFHSVNVVLNPGLNSAWLCYILFFPPYPWHAEVLGPGIEPEPQLQPEAQQWQHWILNLLSCQGTPIYIYIFFFNCCINLLVFSFIFIFAFLFLRGIGQYISCDDSFFILVSGNSVIEWVGMCSLFWYL